MRKDVNHYMAKLISLILFRNHIIDMIVNKISRILTDNVGIKLSKVIIIFSIC